MVTSAVIGTNVGVGSTAKPTCTLECQPLRSNSGQQIHGSLGDHVYIADRVYVLIQFVSQVVPPSAENACSERTSVADTGQIVKRTRILRP